MAAKKVWITSTGKKVPIHLMTGYHLSNALRMIDRKLLESALTPAESLELRQRAVMLRKEVERRMKTEIQSGKKKTRTPQENPTESKTQGDVVQSVGPTSSFCWIPVPDVKALIEFLDIHAPLIDQDRVVRAQYLAVADVLSQYVREAEVRNIKSNTRTP